MILSYEETGAAALAFLVLAIVAAVFVLSNANE